MKTNLINPESGLLPLARLPWQGKLPVALDEKSPWLAELLSELAEDVGDEIAMVGEESIYLKFEAEISKQRHAQYGELVLVVGFLRSTFPTLCSVTGAVMLDHVEAAVKACFLANSHKTEVEDPLEEEIDIALGEEVYDLYFYPPQGIPLAEMVHEYLYLCKNPYPRLEAKKSIDN